MSDYILEMRNITKIYSNGFAANKNVTFNVRHGEIHALAGENGAGKTTLMKILFGLEHAQEGTILFNGEPVHITSPLEAISYGIDMVHQHFMQVPKFTVAENIVLGVEPVKGLFFDRKQAVKQAEEIIEKYQFNVDSDRVLEDLSIGVRQKVELMKALVRGVKLLILDEPTAVLTPQETEELFVQLRHLRDQGISIIFITHKLEEIMKICDRITVLRHGYCVGTKEIAALDSADIARMMVGRDVILKFEKSPAKRGKVVADIEDLVYVDGEGHRAIDGVSLKMYAGEILGIAGVEGNGQSELAESLGGLLPVLSGKICINGVNIKGKTIREIRELGVANITEDRIKDGCALDLSIKENIISTKLHERRFRKGPFLNHKKINEFVETCIAQYEISCSDSSSPVRMLSGGNMQKVIVAREFTADADLIIANQPTRGIDVGTSEMIRRTLIRKTREDNVATLLVSSDLNEVIEVSDRLIVMRKGRIAAEFEHANEVNEELLGEYMLGVRTMEGGESIEKSETDTNVV